MGTDCSWTHVLFLSFTFFFKQTNKNYWCCKSCGFGLAFQMSPDQTKISGLLDKFDKEDTEVPPVSHKRETGMLGNNTIFDFESL